MYSLMYLNPSTSKTVSYICPLYIVENIYFCDALARIRRLSSAVDLIPNSLAKSIKGVFAIFVCLILFFENSCYASTCYDILASWSEIKETKNLERERFLKFSTSQYLMS